MKRRTHDNESPEAQLHRELQDTALALRCAYERFNYVCEAELVEASVYEISSLQAKYNYLLRAAKGDAPRAVSAAAAEGSVPCRS